MRWFAGAIVSILVPSICVALEPVVVMDCEVKYQSVITSEAGKPKTYVGYKDQFVVGDTLKFTFQSYGMGLYASLADNQRSHIPLSVVSISVDQNPVTVGQNFRGRPVVKWSGDYSSMNISQDRVNIDNGTLGTLKLERYYKGDYHGLLIKEDTEMGVQVVTLDCRTTRDQLDQIVASFK